VPYPDPGRSLFDSCCAACHLSNGPGMTVEAPPLDGSPWVAGPEDRLIIIVLHGLRGAIEIKGKTYNQEMPAIGEVLTDDQIASLLSFVRRRFGGASTPVVPADVSRVRAETRNRGGYWTVEELLKRP
jgi:mono/diheme cytochrome c family protein